MPSKFTFIDTPGYKLYKLWLGEDRDRWISSSAAWQQRWEEMANRVQKTVDFTSPRPALKVVNPLEHAARFGGFSIISDKGTFRASLAEKIQNPDDPDAVYGTTHEIKKETEAAKRSRKAAKEHNESVAKEYNEYLTGKGPLLDAAGWGVRREAQDSSFAEAEKILLDKLVLRVLQDKRTRSIVLRAITEALEHDLSEGDVTSQATDYMLFR